MVDTLPHIFLHPQTGLVDVRDHKVHLNSRDIALDQRRLIIFPGSLVFIPHVLHVDDQPHNFCWPSTRRTPLQ